MSDTEDIIEREALPEIDLKAETRTRRYAKSILQKALLSCKEPLKNEGVDKRFLPGLWCATVTVLLASFEDANEVLLVLADRNHGIVGTADNVDVLPRDLDSEAYEAYSAEVSTACEIIVDGLMQAHSLFEQDGIDDRFPSAVLDAALQGLISTWGPDHTRRAISEQATLFIQGVHEPAIFIEPSRYVTPPSPSPEAPQEKVEFSAIGERVRETIEVTPPKRRLVASRRVDAFIHYDLSDSGQAGWAVWMSSLDEDRMDERLLAGRLPDANGRAACLKALHECILCICEGVGVTSGRIDMTSESIFRAIHDFPGTRFPDEAEVWGEIDDVRELHDLDFRHVDMDLTRSSIDRCDRAVRGLLYDA